MRAVHPIAAAALGLGLVLGFTGPAAAGNKTAAMVGCAIASGCDVDPGPAVESLATALPFSREVTATPSPSPSSSGCQVEGKSLTSTLPYCCSGCPDGTKKCLKTSSCGNKKCAPQCCSGTANKCTNCFCAS